MMNGLFYNVRVGGAQAPFEAEFQQKAKAARTARGSFQIFASDEEEPTDEKVKPAAEHKPQTPNEDDKSEAQSINR